MVEFPLSERTFRTALMGCISVDISVGSKVVLSVEANGNEVQVGQKRRGEGVE